jgi:hypothetical protein
VVQTRIVCHVGVYSQHGRGGGDGDGDGDGWTWIAAKDAALASPRAWSSARIVSQAGLDGSLAHAH